MPAKKKSSLIFPAIEAVGLSYVRKSEMIFENFSFSVAPGTYIAVIGPNGGGKTTLLRVLLGLLEPTSGIVRIFGEPIANRAVRKRIGYVPQRGGMIDPTFPASVEEVVRAGRMQTLGLWGRFGKEDAKAVETAMAATHILHLRHRVIALLSGGERQRVLLSRALAAEPDILVLDEPVEGLDHTSREEFYATLRVLNKQGKTIIFVSHDIHRIVREADSAICLRHEVVCHGSKACVLVGRELRNIFHATKEELSEHYE